MSDLDLSAWVSNLPSLDSSLSEDMLVANARVAYDRFNSLSKDDQSRVMDLANERLNITPDKLRDFKPDERTARVYSRVTKREETPKHQEPPKSFEDKWTQASAKYRGQPHDEGAASAAHNRYGYQSLDRRAQLNRIGEIQREAKRTGKSFSQVADERMNRFN
jgi:hypothetical protein